MEYYIDGEILYESSFDGSLLRCLNESKANKALREVNRGICTTHANGHMMATQLQRVEHFWMNIKKYCKEFVRKCQLYNDKINAPPILLFIIASPCPFAMWGVEGIELINPKANNRHWFIHVAIDYFTWVQKAAPMPM
jgi:hypothetical protein